MGDRGFEEEFCLPSELLTDELILMGKENLYKDKRNLTFPRTSLLTESPNESLSYYSNNFLVPPFSSGPKIPEVTFNFLIYYHACICLFIHLFTVTEVLY